MNAFRLNKSFCVAVILLRSARYIAVSRFKRVSLYFIGRKGEHILHNNRITVARMKIIVLYKFERERRKSYIWRVSIIYSLLSK